jgi:hypothetical protein
MNIPGFAAEASLYNTVRQYHAVTAGSSFAGQVLPMATCCDACPVCDPCSSSECPPHDPGCCIASIKECIARFKCLRDCVTIQPPAVCCNGVSCNGNCWYGTTCCPQGEIACYTGSDPVTCVDPSTDPNNCGSCGNSCAPQSCCAGVCCEGGTCCWNGVCVPMAPAPPAYGGNSNWPLYSDCQNIQGLKVQFVVNEAFVPTPASNGFSLQVNGYAPLGPGLPCNGIDWLQYVLIVNNGKASAQIQYWNNEICENLPGGGCCWTTLGLANQCGGSCQGCTGCESPGNTPWLPLGDSLFSQQLLPNNVPSTDIIPLKSVLSVSLKTNTAGQVTEALFEIIIDGVTSSASYKFPPDQQYGFPAFVPVVVASPSSTVNFSSGSGQLSSSVSSGELCVQTEGAPGSMCGVTYSTGWPSATGEDSNAVYGPINPCCGSVLEQSVST